MVNDLNLLLRPSGRKACEIRTIDFTIDALGYASASILYSQGNTKVLVGVTLQQGLPPFLKGQPVGWLSAEYAMLPIATHQRSNRESSQAQRNARSVEISRLIGRCLRTCVNLSGLRDKTITIDCDVLQADGGTRVACITAASMALAIAAQRWFEQKITEINIFTTPIAAISVGVVAGVLVTDLDYQEDSNAEADFNFVITQDNRLIEVQGTSEKTPLAWDVFDAAKNLAQESIKDIFEITSQKIATMQLQPAEKNQNILALLNAPGRQDRSHNSKGQQQQAQQNPARQVRQEQKPGPFSLANRLLKS